MNEFSPPPSEILIYQTGDKQTHIEVRMENESVWLSQKQMADLFQTTVPNVNMHIRNPFDAGELQEQGNYSGLLNSSAGG